MRRILRVTSTVALASLLLAACLSFPGKVAGPPTELGIKASPPPTSYNRGVLTEIPVHDANSTDPSQVDLRHYDLRGADLTDRLGDLVHAVFDIYTQWPEDLPEGFDPEKYMELGKNPGLGVRGLHAKGITGKGVGIAIIDGTLLVDHVEYKDQLRYYEQLGSGYEPEPMHAPAVASIAVGKSVGVAPEADLYMICANWRTVEGQADFAELAKAVDRVVAINQLLPEGRKIRVLSMSFGWSSRPPGYRAMVKAVDNARKQGIFVVSSSLMYTYPGLYFQGLGRDPLADPESPVLYGPGYWWAEKYYKTGTIAKGMEALLIPMDSRTTASMTSTADYTFYAEGGWSWCAPYIAGLYAMACQVKPEVTPASFWTAALATGDTVTLSRNDKTYDFGKIVNPTKLMEALANPD